MLRSPRFELGLPRPQRGVLTTILRPLAHVMRVEIYETLLCQHSLKVHKHTARALCSPHNTQSGFLSLIVCAQTQGFILGQKSPKQILRLALFLEEETLVEGGFLVSLRRPVAQSQTFISNHFEGGYIFRCTVTSIVVQTS